MKTCPHKNCPHKGKAQPLSSFARNSKRGLNSNCKDCVKRYIASVAEHRAAQQQKRLACPLAQERRKATHFKITVEEYRRLQKVKQCDLCRSPLGKKHIDHDHATGHIRGVLCSECNTGLGKLGDTLAALQRAVQYLQREPRCLSTSIQL